MKTKIILLLILLISLFSCEKKYHGIFSMHELLYSNLPEENHHPFEMKKFHEGFYIYENCSSLKKIDGVWVNWIEEENECDYLLNLDKEENENQFRESKRNLCLDSLLGKKEFREIELPQRFFMVFLDKRRVIYFSNYEAKKFFEENIVSIYKELSLKNIGDNDLQKKINQYFEKKKYSFQDLTFANFNWNHWKDSLTHNRIIPLNIQDVNNGWRNGMVGVYQTYMGASRDFRLKVAFNESDVKIEKLDNSTLEGLIELDFKINPTTQSLKLIKVNLPDKNINIDGALSKSSLRRDHSIDEILAIQPSFKFHEEPVKFSIPFKEEEYLIDSIFLTTPKNGDWKTLQGFSAVWHTNKRAFKEINFKKENFWGEFSFKTNETR